MGSRTRSRRRRMLSLEPLEQRLMLSDVTINGTVTWSSSYSMPGNVYIASGGKLIIDSGVTVTSTSGYQLEAESGSQLNATGATFSTPVNVDPGATISLTGNTFSDAVSLAPQAVTALSGNQFNGTVDAAPQCVDSLVGNTFQTNSTVDVQGGYLTTAAVFPNNITGVTTYSLDSYDYGSDGVLIRAGGSLTIASGIIVSGHALDVSDDGSGGTLSANDVTFGDAVNVDPGATISLTGNIFNGAVSLAPRTATPFSGNQFNGTVDAAPQCVDSLVGNTFQANSTVDVQGGYLTTAVVFPNNITGVTTYSLDSYDYGSTGVLIRTGGILTIGSGIIVSGHALDVSDDGSGGTLSANDVTFGDAVNVDPGATISLTGNIFNGAVSLAPRTATPFSGNQFNGTVDAAPQCVDSLVGNTFQANSTVDVQGGYLTTAAVFPNNITGVTTYSLDSYDYGSDGVLIRAGGGLTIGSGIIVSGHALDVSDDGSGGTLSANDVTFGDAVNVDPGATISLTGNIFNGAVSLAPRTATPFSGNQFNGTVDAAPQCVDSLVGNTFQANSTVDVQGGYLTTAAVFPNNITGVTTYSLDSYDYGSDGVLIRAGGSLTIGSGIIVSGHALDVSDNGSGGTLSAQDVTFNDQVVLGSASTGSVQYCKINNTITIYSGFGVSFHDDDLSSGHLTTAGSSTASVNVDNNWWGTTDTSVIDTMITDHNDNSSLPKAIYEPVLTAAPQPPVNNAQLVSESVPAGTQEAEGTPFTEVVTMENSGTTTWSGGANGYTLNRSGTAEFGETSFYAKLDQSSVSPGSNGTFTMSLTAPTTPNTYTETWQMYSSMAAGDAAFGPAVTVQIVVPTPLLVDDAQLVSESVPAGTQEAQGTPFTEVVTMENTGTTTWAGGPNGYTLNRSGTAQFGETSFYAKLDQSSVSPGSNGTFTMSLTAPTTPNTYAETWQMYSSMAAGDAAFGPAVTVQIVVPTSPVDDAQLVSESVAAGTQEAAGTPFTEVVTMENTGTTTWAGGPNGYTLNRSGTAEFGETSFYAKLDQSSVSPGSNGTFTMSLTAPTTPNTYTETWQMYSSMAAGDAAFGPAVTVQIVVPTPLLVDDAQLVSESVPAGTQEAEGTPFTEVVTMENTGTTTWAGGANGYRLNRSGTAQFGEATFYAMLDQSSVSPGATGTFTMDLTAPTTPNTYTETWQMYSSTVAGDVAFGPAVTVQIVVPTPLLVDDAQLVSESVPAGTQEAEGTPFTEVVTMENTGTTTWAGGPNGYTLNRSGTAQFGETSFYAKLDQSSVSPGSNGTFTMSLTAPMTPNTYTESWQMYSSVAAGDAAFGPTVTVGIVVPATTATYNTAFLTDAQLTASNTLTATQIRSFLAAEGSYFATTVKDVDGVSFDLATTIAQAASQYQINPQVLLTTLQKESAGVTTSTRPSDARMELLMGAGSPSTARAQVVTAAQLFRSYQDALTSGGATTTGWMTGVTKTTLDGVAVTPASNAVAGQFTYTPYAGAEWGGNQPSFGGVYLFYYWWNQFGFGTSAPASDLAVNMSHLTLPTPSVPGDKGNVTVTVINQGQLRASGSMEIDLYASTDPDGTGEVLLESLKNQSVNLGYDQSQKYTFSNVQLPTNVQFSAVPPGSSSGTYYLLAVVNATHSIPESNYSNDTASATEQMVYEFGAVGTRKGVVLKLTEADGTVASFSLSGAGAGNVTVSGSEWDLTLTGTTTASKLTITTKEPTKSASGLLSLDDITVSGALGTFSGTGVNLTGAMDVSGSLGTLSLANSGGKSPVGGNVLAGASVSAGSIGTVRIGGSFEGTSAAGIAVNAAAIGSLTVTGGLDYTQLLSTGDIGAVSLGSMADSDVFAGVASGVTTLPSAESDFSSETDRIKSFTITGGSTAAESFINSKIVAWTIGTLKLGYPDGSNGGIPFGVACNKYTTLSFRSPSGKLTTWKYPKSGTFAATDGVVNVIPS